MENDIIMDENPIVENPVDTTLTPTDDVIPVTPEDIPVTTCDGTPNTVSDTCNSIEQNPITIGCFFGTIQESIPISWRFHLKTRKHHIHVALNEYYGRALYIIDNIIEQYQGINGIVEEPYINCIIGDGKNETEYLNELKNYITCNKFILGEHSEINSTIDELLGLIDSTIYKLTSFCENNVKSFAEFCYENLNESFE